MSSHHSPHRTDRYEGVRIAFAELAEWVEPIVHVAITTFEYELRIAERPDLRFVKDRARAEALRTAVATFLLRNGVDVRPAISADLDEGIDVPQVDSTVRAAMRFEELVRDLTIKLRQARGGGLLGLFDEDDQDEAS